jgi:hypothetical protein
MPSLLPGLNRLSLHSLHSLHCTPCNDALPQPPNYSDQSLVDPANPEELAKAGFNIHEKLAESSINICSICRETLSGPAEANPALPDDLERLRASGNWFHRWCIAGWVRTHDTDPLSRKRIHPSEIEGLLAFRPADVNVWPLPARSEARYATRASARDAVASNGLNLQFVADRFKDDPGVVLAAVVNNGFALQYASDRLKNSRQMVGLAVLEAGLALAYASDEMKDDRRTVLVAVRKEGEALSVASDRLRNDRQVVLAAVTQDGFSIRSASERLKGDKEVVLAAVSRNEFALMYASRELKDDREVVLAAVRFGGRAALQWASDELKNDSELVALAASVR